MTAPPAVLVRDLVFSYDREAVLKGATFTVQAGSFVALIGPNGAGKSTLLRVLLGLLRPGGGVVQVFGGPPGDRSRPIGYVPQRVRLPAGFPLSVAEVVLMGRYGKLGLLHRPKAADRAHAAEALVRVGMGEQGGRRFQRAVGRAAAARLDRSGARGRARAPGPRRAYRRARSRRALPVLRLGVRPPAQRRAHGSVRLARSRAPV